MKDVINKTYTPRNLTTYSNLRDTLRPTLEARGTITQAMVIDPSNPRLEFVDWSSVNIYYYSFYIIVFE